MICVSHSTVGIDRQTPDSADVRELPDRAYRYNI
jgi:hypothetical protein